MCKAYCQGEQTMHSAETLGTWKAVLEIRRVLRSKTMEDLEYSTGELEIYCVSTSKGF